MPMTVGIKSREDMKMIFGLCDKDGDGLIRWQDFRGIGQEHFDQEQVEQLLEVMDPCHTESISFIMFCRGIDKFLLGKDCVQRTGLNTSALSCPSSDLNDLSQAHGHSTSPSQMATSDKDIDSVTSGDEIYPLNHHRESSLSNGYITSSNCSIGIELVLDSADTEMDHLNPLHSSSRHTSTSPSPSHGLPRGSPTQVAKNLMMRKHQLNLAPESPSQTNTPSEIAEEEVTKLSDQLSELTSRLNELKEEQKDQEGYRVRLKKENTGLKHRLEEYEELLNKCEQSNEHILRNSQAKLKKSSNKLQHESEEKLMELTVELKEVSEQNMKLMDAETKLRTQLSLLQQEKTLMGEKVEKMSEKKHTLELVLQRTQEQLRTERYKWQAEKEALDLVVHERDTHIQHLQAECEDIKNDRKESSITASDMDSEVNRLKKRLDESLKWNEDLKGQFLQQGKELVTTSSTGPASLEAELENASKQEVVTSLKTSEDMNLRLREYLDGLLNTIIEKHPEMLERI